jgi:hypothetical protein
LLSKFYTDYNNHSIPSDEFFPNILENKYDVPRERVQEAIGIILQNGSEAGVLETHGEGKQPVVRLGTIASAPTGSSQHEPFDEKTGEIVPPPKSEGSQSNWQKICFYITPIGDEGTEQRKHSDMMLRHVVAPVFKDLGMEVVRADAIGRSGIITQQVFEHLAYSKICVADLSFGNENAFYELGVRHAFLLPTIQIIRKGDKIPFDVSQGRTIFMDTSDVYTVMDRAESARRELTEHAKHILAKKADGAPEDNPVAIYLPGIKVTLPD